MSVVVYNPTNRPVAGRMITADRLETLDNTLLAVVNNGKRQSDIVLNKIIDGLKSRYTFKGIKFMQKHSISQAISDDMAQTIAEEYDSVITGIGD